MKKTIFQLDEQDNAGDALGKINYNFLKLNNDLFDLEASSGKNFSTVYKINSLMDKMDWLMAQTNFDELQDLYTTVNLLSSYWGNLEFTVQYPFNPENGFTSSLVFAGVGEELFGSTSLANQENILANALVSKNLPHIKNVSDAKNNFYNNGLVLVNRDDDGNFITWDFLSASNILNILVSKGNNFYYNGRLVDVYNIPYYSVITKSDVNIFTSLVPDYNSKIILSSDRTPILPDKTNLSNSALIVYDTFISDDYEVGDGTVLPITQFVPRVVKLSNIIPENDSSFAAKIQTNNNQSFNSAENNKIHNVALNFLNEKYAAYLYPDSTSINVLFLLYNYVGPNLGSTTVNSSFWDTNTLSEPQLNVEILKKSEVYKTAPSNNTSYDMYYTKGNVYIEKIVTVKYIKNIEMKDIVTVVGGVHKVVTIPISSWKFMGMNIGRSYTPNLFPDTAIISQSNRRVIRRRVVSDSRVQIQEPRAPIYNGT